MIGYLGWLWCFREVGNGGAIACRRLWVDGRTETGILASHFLQTNASARCSVPLKFSAHDERTHSVALERTQ